MVYASETVAADTILSGIAESITGFEPKMGERNCLRVLSIIIVHSMPGETCRIRTEKKDGCL